MLDRTYVFVNNERIPWDDSVMEFVKVESDIREQDVVTFNYKGKQYQSYMVSL